MVALRSDRATQTHSAEDASSEMHSKTPIQTRVVSVRKTEEDQPGEDAITDDGGRRHPLHLPVALEEPLELHRHQQEAEPIDRQQDS